MSNRLRVRLLAASMVLALLVSFAATPALAARMAKPVRATDESNASDSLRYAGRPELQGFSDDLLSRSPALDRNWVNAALSDARLIPSVRRYIMPAPAPVAKNWGVYRSRFVEPVRIRAGLAFWQQQERWLTAAEERWHVPASVILGIIGVETIYGRQTGGFRVLDALATLSFDFPPGRSDRSAFFRAELGDFLLWAHREQVDPRRALGSYAGAMGLPQFMPSSVLKYAVDFDGDGRIDLHNSAADVIGSVANYLASFAWQPGVPTHFPVTPPDDEAQRAALLVPDILPSFSAAEMQARGAALPAAALAYQGPLALVKLQNGEGEPSYVAGTQNFWVITRYNWSSYYALAVIELGEALQRARTRAETPATKPASSTSSSSSISSTTLSSSRATTLPTSPTPAVMPPASPASLSPYTAGASLANPR